MRAPKIAFAIAFPVLSSLGPVLGVGNAAALPRAHAAAPDTPKFYFPRQIKRQLGSDGPFLNITTPHPNPKADGSASKKTNKGDSASKKGDKADDPASKKTYKGKDSASKNGSKGGDKKQHHHSGDTPKAGPSSDDLDKFLSDLNKELGATTLVSTKTVDEVKTNMIGTTTVTRDDGHHHSRPRPTPFDSDKLHNSPVLSDPDEGASHPYS